MTSIADQLTEALTPLDLMEASLGRIYQHHKERPFVILTSWRGNRSLEENKASLKALKKQIRAAGYGFIQLEGVGQEKQGGKLVEASEPSLLVPARKKGLDEEQLDERSTRTPPFLALALKWAKAPGGDRAAAQDFIFYANGAGKAAVINVKSGATDFELSEFKPNTIGQFFSRLKSGRTFKYEWAGVRYTDAPASWAEGVGRESEGEDFTYCESLSEFRSELAG